MGRGGGRGGGGSPRSLSSIHFMSVVRYYLAMGDSHWSLSPNLPKGYTSFNRHTSKGLKTQHFIGFFFARDGGNIFM